MNIQCPNCETIFDLQKKQKSNNKYKCVVCNHKWVVKEDKRDKFSSTEKSNLKTIFILNIAIFLLVILAFIIFRDYLESIDNNWKSIYLFFDMLIPI
jgi:DNA-directed RNA polymerase subunit RPC12/RpoP